MTKCRFIPTASICVLLAIAVLYTLPGCHTRNSGRTADGKVIVRMWTFPMLPELRDQEIYDHLVAEFQKEYPDISVKVETLPWVGRTQKMITAIAGNRAPDCVYLNLDLVAQMVNRGALQPIDSFMSADSREDYDPNVIEAIQINDQIWIFPILRTVAASLVNRNLLKEAGWDPDNPPANWQEIEELAARATKDLDGDGRIDQYGLGMMLGGDSLNFSLWPLLWQAGGQVFSNDGRRAAFNSPEGLEALTFMVDMFRKGYIPRSYLSVTGGGEFSSGNLAYWFGTGSVELTQLRRDIPDLPIDVAPVVENRHRISYSSVAGYAMFKTSKYPEETAAWLNFITRPENMKYFCKSTNYFPCKQSVGSIYEDDPLMAKLERQMPYTRPDINHVYARQVPQILVPEIQQALLGQKTPQQALDAAEKAVNAMLERGE